MIDALRRFAIISRLGPEDVWHKRLRVAVIEREPARLHLHHDAVTRQKDMVRRRQSKAIKQRFVRHDRLWRFQTLPIASAENVGRDHQLKAAHGRLHSDFVAIDIDQFDHPIGITAAGRGDQVRDRLSANLQRRPHYV